MNTIKPADADVNTNSTKHAKKLSTPPREGLRYGYPVPINIAIKAIVDRQFHINTQRLRGKQI